MVLATLAFVSALGGCGAGGARHGGGVPGYVTESFTPQEQRVERGARLIVSDGCSSCHLQAAGDVAPSFLSFAGHRVALVDGRRVLVDERFLHEGLLHPSANEIRGYDPKPMLAAIARAHLARHPGDVAALAAFIEQVGPEAE